MFRRKNNSGFFFSADFPHGKIEEFKVKWPCRDMKKEFVISFEDYGDDGTKAMMDFLMGLYHAGEFMPEQVGSGNIKQWWQTYPDCKCCGQIDYGAEPKLEIWGEWELKGLRCKSIDFADLDFSSSSPVIIEVAWTVDDFEFKGDKHDRNN